MGILNSINGKDKIYFNLIRLIRSDKVFSKEEKDTLTKYLNELKNGTQLNEFVDDEILCFIVTDMLDHKFKGTVKEYLEKNKDCLRFMFPQGTDTPDYDLIKKEVINNYLGKNGIFSNDLFDKTFYALFDEKIHYFQIMNIILSDEATKKYFDDIVEFAVTMGKEIDDYDLFYRELLGCVYAFNNVIDDRKSYLERRLKETRMSYGVYPGVTEETIAKMSRELEKTRMIIDQFEAIKRQIGAFKREIDDKVSYGKDELDKSIDKSKQSIEDCLYGYLDNMQDSINKRADAAVDGVIEESRNRLKEIRITADSIAKEVTSQLLKLHSESDALKSFVSSSEEFKEVVKIANANQELITGVLSLPSSEELAALKNAQVVPATSVVSPVVISNDQDEDNFLVPKFEMCDIILPAFDKKVQFE